MRSKRSVEMNAIERPVEELSLKEVRPMFRSQPRPGRPLSLAAALIAAATSLCFSASCPLGVGGPSQDAGELRERPADVAEMERPLSLHLRPPSYAERQRAGAFAAWARDAAARGQLSATATALLSSSWAELGPRPLDELFGRGSVSGRVNALAIKKNEVLAGRRITLGAAGGGIWGRNTLLETEFSPRSDAAPSLAIGSLAADPEHPAILYAGTGDLAGVGGSGLLKSTDGGATWVPTAMGSFFGAGIHQLWVSPADSTFLLLASRQKGLQESFDSGATWHQLLGIPALGFAVSPADPRRILVSDCVDQGGSANNDLYVSRYTNESGLHFYPLHGPWQVPGTPTGRIEVAFAPTNGSIAWASVAPADPDNGRSGLYRSADGGDTWTRVAWTPTSSDHAVLAVSPADPEQIYVGGVDLYRFHTGDVDLFRITDWRHNETYLPYIHADQHAIAFDPDSASTLYVGNDGGLYVTTDGGATWSDMNAGLGTLQCRNGCVGKGSGLLSLFAGSQDNGSMRLLPDGVTWQQRLGADGFQCAVDSQNNEVLYGTAQGDDYHISSDRGVTFRQLPSPPRLSGESATFYTPVSVDPNDGTRLYGGAQRVCRGISNRVDAVSWTALSSTIQFPDPVYGVRRIAVANTDSHTIYAAGSDRVLRSMDDGANWMSNPLPSGGSVSGLAVNPTAALDVVICREGYANGTVLRSTNGGAWVNVSGDLPPVVAGNLALRPAGSRLDCFLATTTGVYYADLNSSTDPTQIYWSSVGTGLPNAVVADVLLADSDQVIAVTYGRGLWLLRTAPTGLIARAASATSISLAWQDNSTNEAGFQIERGDGLFPLRFSQIATVVANVTTYLDTSVAANSTYTYRVRAFTSDGTESAYSNRATASTTTYSISGAVTSGGLGVSGVTISAGGLSTTTSSTGAYTLGGLVAGSYTVTPSKMLSIFSPASQRVTLGPSVSGINFTTGRIVLTGLWPTPAMVTGGQPFTWRLDFSAPLPSDTVVRLTSSNHKVALMPRQVTALAGEKWHWFQMPTRPVTRPVTVKCTATLQGVEKVATLTIKPAGRGP
jgi:photosystem II stability/assembly factor-like uncharacterized protein